MAAAIAEPPHLETDLKTLCLSTVATQWRPLAEQAAASVSRRPTTWLSWSIWR